MKKLTLLLMVLFVTATLYGSQMFKGNVSINISGDDVPEQMISVLEEGHIFEIHKDTFNYVTFPVTLKKGKNAYTYEDSGMKITYKPKTKKLTIKVKYPSLALYTESEDYCGSAPLTKGTISCSGTFLEDISSALDSGDEIALSDYTEGYGLFSATWKMTKKGKNLVLDDKSTELSVSVKITPKKRSAKCVIKCSSHWLYPRFFRPNEN